MSKQKFNYGWVVAFVCFFMSFVVLGLGNSPLSLYIVPVTKQLGFSRGDFSLVFTLVTFTTMLIQLVFGFFVNRFGVRSLMIAGSLLAPLAYFVFSQAGSLPAFYAGGILLGAAFAFASVTAIAILVHDWFQSSQGSVLGVIMAASGFGGYVFSRVVGKYLAANGFQAAFLLSAAVLAAAALPVIFLIKPAPQNQGGSHAGSGHGIKGTMSLSGFFKIRGMATALLAVFLTGVVIHPVLVNTPAYLVEKGFDAVFAAEISAAVFFVLAVAKLALGVIHDRLGIRVCMLLGLGAFVVAALILVMAASTWTVYLFVLFDGLAVASLALLVPLFARAILGPQHYSSYLGVFIAVLSAGVSVGVPVISYAYDKLGSYSGVIGAFAGVGAVALALALISLRKEGEAPAPVSPQATPVG